MLKLMTNKDNIVRFDIDIQSAGDNITGYFRLIHENIEYGFPVKILGNRNKAEIKIPALNKILPSLTETTLNAKLEFVGGNDYIEAWSDKIEVSTPRLSIKTEGVQSSEEEGSPTFWNHKNGTIVAAPVIEVSDEVWEKEKPRPKAKVLSEAEKKYEKLQYEERRAELNKTISESGKGGFSDFFSKEE